MSKSSKFKKEMGKMTITIIGSIGKKYYHFNADETLGYVGENKMKRMIAGWGWKRKDFVEESELKKLFKNNSCKSGKR